MDGRPSISILVLWEGLGLHMGTCPGSCAGSWQGSYETQGEYLLLNRIDSIDEFNHALVFLPLENQHRALCGYVMWGLVQEHISQMGGWNALPQGEIC